MEEASSSQEITQLLQAWSAGDESALKNLVPMVRTELRRLASHYIGKEYPGHVLQTTALVNEAYLHSPSHLCWLPFNSIACVLLMSIIICNYLIKNVLWENHMRE